ncbi:hypothetical protein [Streptomyces sp. CB01201]|uniref:hypothetical protein n=1 Tax=Streptomyces sp. CB01201 TaxID=2020324 RepID=UPI000C2753C4|nr:hypothetical protein [Streptomyces sp. CB01201]
MSTTLRIGRWTVGLYQRAVNVTREPDPNCPDCSGSRGGWIAYGSDAGWDECACLDQLRTFRLPLWPRARHTETEPF